MPSPKAYYDQLSKLSGIMLEASTADEAKTVLKDCREHQKRLRQLKKEINLDIKAVREHYRQLTAEASRKQHFITGSIFGRKTAGSMRADDKRALAAERDDSIRPYQELKLTIDAVIHQFDQAKAHCQKLIDEAKGTQGAKPRARKKEDDVISQIERLGKLKEQGILTDEEFEAKKEELLARL